MGDQAVNIAEKALIINQEPPLSKPSRDLVKLTEAALKIVRDALDSFMETDPAKAKEILERDDMIDDLNDQLYDEVQKIMQENVGCVRAGVSLIMVCHNLERVGDLATNIAEDVIYVKRGIDVRHHIRERRAENT
jgi:phosphate transport system protein